MSALWFGGQGADPPTKARAFLSLIASRINLVMVQSPI
jgi:hypothetical protein